VQTQPTPPDSPPPTPAEPPAPAAWPGGHVLVALVLLGLVSGFRVAHAITRNEVFGFESSAALIALILMPFVLRDLLMPRIRAWRAARTSQGPGAAPQASARTAAVGTVAGSRKPAGGTPSATVIRLADRKRPRTV
jgi:hypothetical protein